MNSSVFVWIPSKHNIIYVHGSDTETSVSLSPNSESTIRGITIFIKWDKIFFPFWIEWSWGPSLKMKNWSISALFWAPNRPFRDQNGVFSLGPHDRSIQHEKLCKNIFFLHKTSCQISPKLDLSLSAARLAPWSLASLAAEIIGAVRSASERKSVLVISCVSTDIYQTWGHLKVKTYKHIYN